MSIHTKHFIMGVTISVVIFGSSYFINGPDVMRLFITTGVGVLAAMIAGYILDKNF